jgi:DNA-binding response OmpR family regulator
MAKLLLIEDDKEFARVLLDALEDHDVDHVADGTGGLDWLRQCRYEAAIIDWQLPSMDGLEVCRRFRQEGGSTPILMLTAKDRIQDQIAGLDAGADDYLSKPFDPAVLHARLRAILRRAPNVISEVVSVGRFTLYSRQKVVAIDQYPLRLTKREYAIMELLLRAKGEPISPSAILERAWPSDCEVSPDNVRCHVARIRTQVSKISKDAADCIQSVYGTGYLIKALE